MKWDGLCIAIKCVYHIDIIYTWQAKQEKEKIEQGNGWYKGSNIC